MRYDTSKEKDKRQEMPEIEIPTKDEVKGHRNPKKKDKDYEKKYGNRDDRWN